MKEKVAIGKLFKTIACATLTFTLACSLAACGKSMPSNPTASEAFNAGGVWYHSNSTDLNKIAKDEKIDQVFIFQNGEVTLYNFDYAGYSSDDVPNMEKDDKHFNPTDMSNASIQLTYGDLNKLSQKDIIKLVKNTHSANFEAHKKATIEKCTYEIDRLQPAIKRLEKEVNDLVTHKDELLAKFKSEAPTFNPTIGGKKSYDPEEEYDNMLRPRQDALKNWKERLTFYQGRLETLNSLTYQEPKPVKYELAIETDKSGNAATNESLDFEAEILDLQAFLHIIGTGSDGYTDAPYTSKKQNITFGVGGAFQTVYDTRFGGYDKLFTIIDGDTNPYTLDSRDSKGVTVK